MWHQSGSFADWMPLEALYQPEPSLESPDTKRRFKNLVDVSGMNAHLTEIPARPASTEELGLIHTSEYIESIRERSAQMGGEAGEGTPFGRGSFEIASLAAGGCIAAVDAVLDGVVDNVYALVRPPGHHAEPARGRGYCIFANAAIAVRHAQAIRGLARVAIVDWDVHHGNGSETAFYDDPSVLTISLHQEEHYPAGRGRVTDAGEGAGVGKNLNIPLPAGTGRGGYEYAFERVVLPALDAFEPELIVVASGLDASWTDPGGAHEPHTRVLRPAHAHAAGGRRPAVWGTAGITPRGWLLDAGGAVLWACDPGAADGSLDRRAVQRGDRRRPRLAAAPAARARRGRSRRHQPLNKWCQAPFIHDAG